jgi:hypothetical protein
MTKQLGDVELFALIISGLCHDLEHPVIDLSFLPCSRPALSQNPPPLPFPSLFDRACRPQGVNNPFLVASRSDLATLYNDRSVCISPSLAALGRPQPSSGLSIQRSGADRSLSFVRGSPHGLATCQPPDRFGRFWRRAACPATPSALHHLPLAAAAGRGVESWVQIARARHGTSCLLCMTRDVRDGRAGGGVRVGGVGVGNVRCWLCSCWPYWC